MATVNAFATVVKISPDAGAEPLHLVTHVLMMSDDPRIDTTVGSFNRQVTIPLEMDDTVETIGQRLADEIRAQILKLHVAAVDNPDAETPDTAADDLTGDDITVTFLGLPYG